MSESRDVFMVLFNMAVPKKVILDDEDFVTSFIDKMEIIGITTPEVELVDYKDGNEEYKVIVVKNYKIKLPLLEYVIDALYSKKYFPVQTYYLLGIDIDESDKNITFVNTAIIKKCSNYLTKLKSALDTFKMMVKRNMIDMN